MSFGKRYSRDDFAHIFERQFQNAPEGWRDFIAAVLFANGCRYDPNGRMCWPDTEGLDDPPTYPVRWFSRKLKNKLLQSWKIFHDGIPAGWGPQEAWGAHDRLWACAGYQAVGSGIGLDDFAYEMRISEVDIDAIEAAFKAANFGYLEHISCFNGVID